MTCGVRKSRPDLSDTSFMQLFVERGDFALNGITQSRSRHRFHKSLRRRIEFLSPEAISTVDNSPQLPIHTSSITYIASRGVRVCT